jgi:putative ABC transport system ATP-binding protein
MIQLHAIRKAFNQGHDNEYWALDGIDLNIEANKVTALARSQRLGQDHAA